MNGKTHLTLGAAAGLLVAAATHADPLYCLAAGCIGGLLPDIDHPQSMLSGWIPGSGIVGLLGVRHRGVTHSILFMVAIAAGFYARAHFYPTPVQVYLIFGALMAGVASHIVSDMLTPAGVPLLWPLRANWKAAPGIVLQAGKFIGIVELAVFLLGLFGIGLGIYLIVTPQF